MVTPSVMRKTLESRINRLERLLLKSNKSNINEGFHYTVDDFNTADAPEGLVQYVLDNVDDFDRRYNRAYRKIGALRVPLSRADYKLSDDIYSAIDEWCDDNGEENNYDPDDIFG